MSNDKTPIEPKPGPAFMNDRAVAMARALREVGSSTPVLLVLEEREQSVQSIPVGKDGAPPQTVEDIVGVEHAIVEANLRMRAASVRELGAGTGLFECRVVGADEHGHQKTMIQYIHASSILRVGVQAQLD